MSSRCRSQSFYLAPNEKREFADSTLAARLPDGTLVSVTHRDDVGRIRQEHPDWDGLLLCGPPGGLDALREALNSTPELVEAWYVDERVIEGRRPDDAAAYTLQRAATEGAQAAGGLVQIAETLLEGAPVPVSKKLRFMVQASIDRRDYEQAEIVCAAYRTGLLAPDAALRLLAPRTDVVVIPYLPGQRPSLQRELTDILAVCDGPSAVEHVLGQLLGLATVVPEPQDQSVEDELAPWLELSLEELSARVLSGAPDAKECADTIGRIWVRDLREDTDPYFATDSVRALLTTELVMAAVRTPGAVLELPLRAISAETYLTLLNDPATAPSFTSALLAYGFDTPYPFHDVFGVLLRAELPEDALTAYFRSLRQCPPTEADYCLPHRMPPGDPAGGLYLNHVLSLLVIAHEQAPDPKMSKASLRQLLKSGIGELDPHNPWSYHTLHDLMGSDLVPEEFLEPFREVVDRAVALAVSSDRTLLDTAFGITTQFWRIEGEMLAVASPAAAAQLFAKMTTLEFREINTRYFTDEIGLLKRFSLEDLVAPDPQTLLSEMDKWSTHMSPATFSRMFKDPSYPDVMRARYDDLLWSADEVTAEEDVDRLRVYVMSEVLDVDAFVQRLETGGFKVPAWWEADLYCTIAAAVLLKDPVVFRRMAVTNSFPTKFSERSYLLGGMNHDKERLTAGVLAVLDGNDMQVPYPLLHRLAGMDAWHRSIPARRALWSRYLEEYKITPFVTDVIGLVRRAGDFDTFCTHNQPPCDEFDLRHPLSHGNMVGGLFEALGFCDDEAVGTDASQTDRAHLDEVLSMFERYAAILNVPDLGSNVVRMLLLASHRQARYALFDDIAGRSPHTDELAKVLQQEDITRPIARMSPTVARIVHATVATAASAGSGSKVRELDDLPSFDDIPFDLARNDLSCVVGKLDGAELTSAQLILHFLESPREVRRNATFMGNCTANYIPKIRRTQSVLFAACERNGTRVLNVEVRRDDDSSPWSLGEVNSRFNTGEVPTGVREEIAAILTR